MTLLATDPCFYCGRSSTWQLALLDQLQRREPYDTLADAIHDAARLAQIVRANGLMIVNGVVYGGAGHGITVTIAAHTQALAQLAAVEADNETLRQDNAALRSRLAPDDEGEFEPEPELIDAGDR